MKENPAELAGSLSKSALANVLARLFAGLLGLLSGVVAGLLTLLCRLLARLLLTLLSRFVALSALLRLALIVLVHLNLQKLLNYNLNGHHSNYRRYLCLMHTKTSLACGYIFMIRNHRLVQWLKIARSARVLLAYALTN
jgi:hypothetical protein